MTLSELLGMSGAALSGYAYLPQITHLLHERCSAGLSERAFTLWLIASGLMTIHAFTIRAPVFILLGGLQLFATATIAYFSRRYRGLACPSHAMNPAAEAEVTKPIANDEIRSTPPRRGEGARAGTPAGEAPPLGQRRGQAQ